MFEKKKLKFNRRVLIGLALGVFLVGLVVKNFWPHSDFRYAGTIEATQVEVPARISSVISKIDVHEGDKVQKGQLLVQLSCEDVEISSKLARTNYTRAQKLFRVGAMPRDQFDQISTQYQDAMTRLKWCEITSPIQGYVETKYHEVGEWVNPGAKLLSLTDLSDVWAYIYVPQNIVFRLKPGMKLKGFLPEMENSSFQGRIEKINSEAEFTPKNVQTQEERTRLVYGVKIGFENPQETLKPGMTIEVQLPEQ